MILTIRVRSIFSFIMYQQSRVSHYRNDKINKISHVTDVTMFIEKNREISENGQYFGTDGFRGEEIKTQQ